MLSFTSTTFTFSAPAAPASGDLYIKAEFNGKSAQSSTQFAYTSTNVPTITQISPSVTSPVQKVDMTITGTGFGTDKSLLSAYLSNSTHARVYQLSVFTVEDTKLVVVLPGGKTGSFFVEVFKSDIGAAIPSSSAAVEFKYQISVSSISPTSGSLYGGTVITITGENFSTNNNNNQVSIGPDKHNIPCDVISSTSTQIKCRTRVAPAPDPSVMQAGMVYDPEFINNEVDVVVMQKAMETAVCTGTCKFKYEVSITPNVTEDL